MASIRAKKALTNMVENGGNIGKAMIDAGYSPNTAKTPKKLTEQKEFKEEALSFVQKLEKERDRLIAAMSKKNLDKVQYGEGIRSADIVIKNMQLLSGKATERTEIDIESLTKIKKSIKGIL